VAAGRVGGLAARMGGEEFLVAFPGLTVDEAFTALEDVRRRIEDHDWATIAPGLAVTASVGAALAGPDGTDRTSLFRVADDRLYAAKRYGRNRVVFLGADDPAGAVA
jgi:two-component system, cell cycle response regulator